MANLEKLRFHVEARKTGGEWELVAAFISDALANNFAALKGLYDRDTEYRVVAA